MRWYGHVMRRDEECVGKRVMGIEVQGSGRERKTEEEVGGLCERRPEREGTVGRGDVRPSCMEATIVPHRPHIEVR